MQSIQFANFTTSPNGVSLGVTLRGAEYWIAVGHVEAVTFDL